MNKLKIRKSLAVAGMLSLLILVAPGFAQAATEHVVTVKLEFSDAPNSTCSLSTVVVSAASCSSETLRKSCATARELTDSKFTTASASAPAKIIFFIPASPRVIYVFVSADSGEFRRQRGELRSNCDFFLI